MPRDRGGPKAGMWIALHDGMPDHPKIEDLSDRAFRALVTLWCWCGRHLTDGAVTAKVWRKHTTPSVRRELVEAGLVDLHDDGSVEMHDYLDWQRSSRDVEQVAAVKRRAGQMGNHKRWHVEKGVVDPECEWCATGPDESQQGSHVRSVDNSVRPDSARVSAANDTLVSTGNYRSQTGDLATSEHSLTSENLPGVASQVRSHLDRREEKRREETYRDLGGGAADRTAHEPPAPQRPRCKRHAHLAADDPGPNCVGCRDARLHAEAETDRAAQREQVERAAAGERRRACGACDEHGWTLGDDGRPLEPARRCNHATPLRLVEGATA